MTAANAELPFVVIVDGREHRKWGRYASEADALAACAALLKHGLPARIERREPPEFGSSQRAFLVAMFAIGAVKPGRVVERVVAEVEREATS